MGIRLLCRCHAGHYEERSANARLIAAAPDLLALCKDALMTLLECDRHFGTHTLDLRTDIAAAIAKVQGE
jgi:hypothetical protein